MRTYALAISALVVAGCGGNGSTTVTPTSTPPPGGGNSGGAAPGGTDGGVAMPGGGGSGGGTSGTGGGGMGGGGSGGMGGGGGGGGGGMPGGGGGTSGGCTSTAVETVLGGGHVAVDDTSVYYERWTGKLGPDEAFAVAKATFGTGPERDVGTIDGGNTRGRLLTDANGLWAIDVGCLEHYDPTTRKFNDVGGCVDLGYVQFAQDDGGFYGTGDDGVVRRIDKATGAATALTAKHQWPGGIAVAGGFVYFSGDDHILRVPTSGGTEEIIVFNAAGGHQLAADAGHVYYGDGAGRVFSAPATPNTTPTLLVTVGLGISAMVSDDAHLYFAAQVDPSNDYGEHDFDSIEAIGKDGSNHVQLAPKQDAVNTMALDADHVYWSGNYVGRVCK